MRGAIYCIMIFILWSCNRSQGDQIETASRWTKLKDSFAIKNATEFKLEKGFRYKDFHTISCKLFDSTMSDQWCKTYLYSWQERDSSFIEFTVIMQQEDRGVQIVYYVFNHKDSLISATPVASGNVSDLEFKMWSAFTSADTLRSTSSVTSHERNGMTKGDTSVFEIIFDEYGKTTEKTISEKKELKLDDAHYR